MTRSRTLAVSVLDEVLSKNQKPKDAMDRLLQGIDRRERDFLMEIVYGVLRSALALDWILGNFLSSPSRIGSRTQNNLRIALYQLRSMRVPDRAAVHEAVEIEKSFLRQGKPELVNAVLRNYLRQSDRFTEPLASADPLNAISLNTSHPRWLISRWTKRFGAEEASALARANNEVPPLTIRVNTLRTTRDRLMKMLGKAGIEAALTRYSPDGITLKGKWSYNDLGLAEGLFMVQDEASQLVSLLLGPREGERVLDACAAPGGKTTHIAQLMGDRGTVVAVEKDPVRIEKLRENVSKLGITSVTVMNEDIREAASPGFFDRILLDAPCSSLGVIRRNPDVKYRHSRKTLREFSLKQLDLLLSVAEHLAESGTMVYSVCSTEPEEGEAVIEAFLKRNRDFRIIEAEENIPVLLQKDGFFRTYPHRDGMDGFFGVKLCRKKYPFS